MKAGCCWLLFVNLSDSFPTVIIGVQSAGLDMQQGVVGDMKKLGVREAFKSKLQVGKSAASRGCLR